MGFRAKNCLAKITLYTSSIMVYELQILKNEISHHRVKMVFRFVALQSVVLIRIIKRFELLPGIYQCVLKDN